MWYTPKFQIDTENEAIFEAGKYIFQQAHHFKGIYSSIFGGVLVSILREVKTPASKALTDRVGER